MHIENHVIIVLCRIERIHGVSGHVYMILCFVFLSCVTNTYECSWRGIFIYMCNNGIVIKLMTNLYTIEIKMYYMVRRLSFSL